MNLILFEPDELAKPLPRTDPRAEHILNVLRLRPCDTFDAGLINGPHGKATLLRIDTTANELVLSFAPSLPSPPLASAPAPTPTITLIVGLPRPQTARKILFEATTLGVRAIHFVTTEKTDPNYASSTLWSSGEWRRHLVDAAQQAFDTRLPLVTWDRTLAQTLSDVANVGVSDSPLRVALDNYEATVGLRSLARQTATSACVAIGPERGWGERDRQQLRAAGFTLAHLGPRVLRVETAVVAALAFVSAP
ncbi:16S rRNA (uracil(1498)-N(3))-methyltransferase [Opitutaceae bacterium TAV4]|nr:16S rRNA (uracil(1498)-N(3))-methyltransferase [Opitutaceae bacterium TAV4]RRK00565.1 16S rRNA (uracil(1498)-N(3))-methyltransferase [Opitutaceae bacterium TAV3]RRK01982.1 16S rRNA (uracil(1498)-N(3))-methyltransferase [Opitutaceae bacterium TAV3]